MLHHILIIYNNNNKKIIYDHKCHVSAAYVAKFLLIVVKEDTSYYQQTLTF